MYQQFANLLLNQQAPTVTVQVPAVVFEQLLLVMHQMAQSIDGLNEKVYVLSGKIDELCHAQLEQDDHEFDVDDSIFDSEYEDYCDDEDCECLYEEDEEDYWDEEDCDCCKKDYSTPYVGMTREAIINQAYADIERICSQPHYNKDDKLVYAPNYDTVQFHVNSDKRTTVALLHDGDSTGKVVDKAISKCCPTDNFHHNIGAAIAVHRLFGIPVPEYLTQVPNN